jgi:hypothetical protein
MDRDTFSPRELVPRATESLFSILVHSTRKKERTRASIDLCSAVLRPRIYANRSPFHRYIGGVVSEQSILCGALAGSHAGNKIGKHAIDHIQAPSPIVTQTPPLQIRNWPTQASTRHAFLLRTYVVDSFALGSQQVGCRGANLPDKRVSNSLPSRLPIQIYRWN